MELNGKGLIVWAIVLVLLGIGYLLYLESGKAGPAQPSKEGHDSGTGCAEGDTHEHADFLVYLNGKRFDFAQEKYMDRHEARAHMHDMVGTIAHKHWKGATWGEFFAGMGMKLNGTCVVLDDGRAYCNDEGSGKMLKMYVNGTRLEGDFGGREIRDLDRVLFTYGNESEAEIDLQLASVPDEACLYSDRCPDRGGPLGEGSSCEA